MAKLYYKFGAMGSSKTAQALMTKFNYEEKGMTVWLIKPGTDTRDGADIIRSRIGLQQQAQVIHPDEDIIAAYHAAGDYDVIIADEAQFLTPEQIDGLRWLVDEKNIPVLCFGLRTDFLTHFFPGAKRLMELADSITEIKTICECGRKATVNARFDDNGKIVNLYQNTLCASVENIKNSRETIAVAYGDGKAFRVKGRRNILRAYFHTQRTCRGTVQNLYRVRF